MRLSAAAQTTPASSSFVTTCRNTHARDVLHRRGFSRPKSAIFGPNLKLPRSQSCVKIGTRVHVPLRRACSASYDAFDGEEFTKQVEEMTQKLNVSTRVVRPKMTSFYRSEMDLLEPALLGIQPELQDWPAREEIFRDIVARRANSVELPLSLRMIKKKQIAEQRVREEEDGGGVHTMCSTKCAFSSMVRIVREIQREALELRGFLLNEELEVIESKVQREMSSSFVWLFKEVFYRTPVLMVEIMGLVADFSAQSMEKMAAIEASLSLMQSKLSKEETSLMNKGENSREMELVSSLEALYRRVQYPNVMPNEDSGYPIEEMNEEELELWRSMVEEAKGVVRVEGEFVSPVTVEVEEEDHEEYYRTDLLYQIGLSQEPNNPLLLSNYAQFLCVFAHDYDRAEECFKRAIQFDPTDAEVLSQFANFLWLIRKDLWGAEERFQQAVAAEPDNSYHASKYASFLWSTGGDDTCYPVDASDQKNT